VNVDTLIQGKVHNLHFSSQTLYSFNPVLHEYSVRNGGKNWVRIRPVGHVSPQTVTMVNGGRKRVGKPSWVADHMVQGQLASRGVVAIAETAKEAFVQSAEYVFGHHEGEKE